MERRRKLGRFERSVGYKNYRSTNDRRCGVVYNIAQQSGMGN
jgi:hypothetical protein